MMTCAGRGILAAAGLAASVALSTPQRAVPAILPNAIICPTPVSCEVLLLYRVSLVKAQLFGAEALRVRDQFDIVHRFLVGFAAGIAHHLHGDLDAGDVGEQV